MYKDIKKAMLFILAGCVGAATNFILYIFFFKVLGIWYIYASITSYILAAFVGFSMQKYLTFKNTSTTNIHKQVIRYFFFSSLNLVINILLLSFFVEILSIDKVLAKMLTLGTIAIWSYFVYKKYVFAK